MGTTGLVAILFTDLVGSTDAAARLGEEANELRQAHFALLREALGEHAGTEVKNLGDGLMVAFPAASNAVACAVAMQQAVARHNRRGREPLEMRVGVAVGEATCEDFDYFGTPVIEASRLCAQAAGGQILVTDLTRTLMGSRGGHRFEALGSLQLKGLPDPVAVHEVASEALVETGPPLPSRVSAETSVALVGRATEWELLEQAWKEAEQGSRRVVFVAGEPGIGKTRLASEIALAAYRQGALVLLGTCDEDLAVPYQPFVEALRHLVAVLPEEVLTAGLGNRGGELGRLLPELAGTSTPQTADADAERYLLFNAVAGLLAGASRWRPVLLILDDLHWATKPTVLMLKHLIRSAEPLSLLVVGTYRDSDIGRGHPLAELLADLRREAGGQRLTLRGLSASEAVALMEHLAGHEMKGDNLRFAQAVYAETDGSPFFMRELLRHLAEEGEVVKEDERWTYRGDLSAVGIPESVREVIGQRVSRLPEATERLLTLGAVIGLEFDVAVLGPTVAEELEPARQARLVEEVAGSPGRFRFVHALIRHTLYEELGSARRMELHREVAQRLESLADGTDTYLAELAHHWGAATPGVAVDARDAAKAAGYAEAAGRRAMISLAYEEATHHFEGALRAMGRSADSARRCDLLIALGEAQRCAGEPAHRETLLEAGHLATELGDAGRAARAALSNQRGFFSRLFDIDFERVAALEAALDLVGPTTTPVRARLLANLATELHFTGDERRLGLAQEALAIAREIQDSTTLSHVLDALCFAMWGLADVAERARIADELSELAGRLGDRTIEFESGVNVFFTASEQGDMERADSGLAACTNVAEDLGQPLLRWRVSLLRGHRALAAGRFEEVERAAAESLRLGEAAGQPDAFVYSHATLFLLNMLRGRPEQAAALLPSVIEYRADAVTFRAELAWALAEAGQQDEARAILADLRTAGDAGGPRDYLRRLNLCVLARAVHRLEDASAAVELYDCLFPHRDGIAVAQPTWFGPVAYDLGLLATTLQRFDAAEAHFARAADVEERVGAWGHLVHTQLEWARMLVRRARPEDSGRARDLLEAAQAGARELGLTDLEPRIEALLAKAD